MWSDMMKVKTTFMLTTIATAFHVLVEKISTDVIHPDVRYLPGLLHLVVLAVHGVVDSQISCT